ncbi:MAG: cytochrome c [Kiloniellales bacterium]|nr:cytochrome c [Kiloniellales bacterium]
MTAPPLRRLGIGLALLILAALAGVLLWSPSERRESGVLRPDDRSVVQAGRQVYAEHCASCHGADLEGQPNWQARRPDGLLPAPPHDASGHTWHHPASHLIRFTKYGPQVFAGPGYKSEMPAYEGILSDTEILAVLSYIKSTWPPEIRRRHDDLDARASSQ